MMPSFQSILLAGAAAMLPLGAAAHAAQKEAPVAETFTEEEAQAAGEAAVAAAAEQAAASAEAQKAKMQREMDEAIALVEKMFDTGSLPPIEPARLALGQQTMTALIPAGSLEKMIDNLYGKMFKTIMGEFGGQSDLMLSIQTGVESEQIATLDEATKAKVTDMFDPHRKEREEQITKVIKPLISEALADVETPMRAGMAKAYARKFSAAQLTDLNSFLATPTGSLYASEWMALQADPEVMLAIIKAMPPLITKFIDRAPTIEKDMKELPKEKQLADFDDKELAKLAKLMKVDVKLLKEQRDMLNAPVEEAAMAVAVEAADDYAVDAAADAATVAADAAMAAEVDAAAAGAAEATSYAADAADDRSEWSDAERKQYEEMESAYSELGEKMDALRQQANARVERMK